MAYYFLMAQLPYLSFGQNAPMSSADFRDLAQRNLSPSDARFLPYCTLDPFALPGPDPVKAANEADSLAFIAEWRAWERSLRLNLARYRAAKLKRDAPSEIPASPADAVSAAKAASAMDSPLEAEIFLDEARWSAIEALQGIAYFDVNTVYAYLLKLLLMERRSKFKTGEGFAQYKGLYAAIMDSSTQSGAPK
jgi:hypothetical protein